ncbi:MAG: hypothetical protein GY913_23440 [Proteobacteria bacterium]|nr:hypothetical protein [Pseudomonadota bacterium]MCP4919867.1 hypothetical protein [Pseudomonadota bacterium]
MSLWIGGLLVFARLSGLALTLPVLSSQGVPKYISVLGAGMITLVLAPALPAADIPATVGILLLGVAGEVALGMLLGAVVAALFGAIALGTELMGLQMGFGMATLFNPFLKIQSGALGTLASWLASLVFLGAGLHLRCLELLGSSFDIVRPGEISDLIAAGPVLLEAIGASIKTGAALAGPVLALVWMVNVFVAVLTRLAPRMNVYFSMGSILTAAAGLSLFGAALPWLLTTHLQLLDGSSEWMARIVEVVGG